MSISVEHAIELVGRCAVPSVSERLPLLLAAGRTLCADLTAPMDQPPFDRSPLDGYAVRAADIRGASEKTPAALPVVETIFAGMAAQRPLQPGEAVRIMTGAMLPAGADCVVRQEDTDEGADIVNIRRAHTEDDNRVFAGEDFKKGEILLHAGTRLNATALSVAAAAGCAAVSVRRRPRAAVVATGDELVEPGNDLPTGKIYDSNLTYMCARLQELGAEIVYADCAGDDLERICGALTAAAACADLIVTTGGVSVGQKDLLPDALCKLNAETVFHGVAMKPGMPTLFARVGGVPCLALSGNPFAAAVALELLVRPLFSLPFVRKRGVLESRFDKESRGRRFIRGFYTDGVVTLPEGHSNGQMRSMVGCNCLLDVPAGTGRLNIGDEVEVLML